MFERSSKLNVKESLLARLRVSKKDAFILSVLTEAEQHADKELERCGVVIIEGDPHSMSMNEIGMTLKISILS